MNKTDSDYIANQNTAKEFIEKFKTEGIYILEENIMNKFKIVKKYIDEYDYYGLLKNGAPCDEFDKYSLEISEIIDDKSTVEEIALVISEIMDNAFGKEINPNNYIEVSTKIINDFIEYGFYKR